jgi:hypothetical protein
VRVAAIAAIATRVFPAPVGRTTTPRRPDRRHARSASAWYGRSVTARMPDGGTSLGGFAF